ncbi:MAG: phosphoribosylglycinamide formyltransferase [Planctomycetota bacterium]|jgi:formyltetrahydrofolate-dependent phosphoribosylglycinamide formyltransferase
MTSTRPIRLGVLLSGGGQTLQNLCDQIAAGRLTATVEMVISSRPGAYGLTRAKNEGLATCVVHRRQTSAAEFDAAITAALVAAEVELVCMAGFLSLWRIPSHFEGRVMNIHPALLPDFGGQGFWGHRVHEAVLAAGRKESGCTVHFCDNLYDHGPIILQRRIAVLPDDTPDTLAARVFEQECMAYPEAIGLFAAGRLEIESQRVVIRD